MTVTTRFYAWISKTNWVTHGLPRLRHSAAIFLLVVSLTLRGVVSVDLAYAATRA